MTASKVWRRRWLSCIRKDDSVKPKVAFVRMLPFDIAFYDPKLRMIFIDKKFKDRPDIYPYIIRHELHHVRSRNLIDLFDEVFDETPWRIELEKLKLKPLSVMQFIVPFSFLRFKNRNIFYIEWSRMLISAVVAASFLMFYLSI